MANKEPPYRQPETLQLAPDALVFINGSDTVSDDQGNTYQIRNDINEITTSLCIDSVPGTAGFSIVIPDHSIRRTSDRRYSALKMMSEIEIYFRGRFPKDKEDGTVEYPYYPAFWGVITSISENYSDGMHSIQVSCADILKWWEITRINVNPSLFASNNVQAEVSKENPNIEDVDSALKGQQEPTKEKIPISAYGNVYANDTIPTILLKLSKVSTKNLQPANDYLFQKLQTVDKISESLSKQDVDEMMNYWIKRLDLIARGLRIYALKTPIERFPDGTIYKAFLDMEKLNEIHPYVLNEGSAPVTQSVMKSYLEIINELKDPIHFEFFMDVTGELIFKPPFYNMNVITNTSSVIRDLDIISWGFTQNEAEVVTRIDVKGSYLEQYNIESPNAGIAINTKLAKQYGIRVQERDVRWIYTADDCFNYAQLELNRVNSLISQGTVTIIGRPELRLGYPVYLASRDCFFYITGIEHSFSFGGTFTTTLTLKAERKRKRDPKTDDVIKNEIFRNIGEVNDVSIPVSGSSYVDEVYQTNNFMSKITTGCVPSKRKRPDIIQPNFLATLENITSTKQGEWKSFKDIKLPENFDSKVQFQTTDDDGFELIPFYKYGKDLSFSTNNVIEQSKEQFRTEQSNAAKALTLSDNDLRLKINPNNIALTFEDENSSMLTLYNTSPDSNARKALTNNPVPQDQAPKN